MKKLVIILLFVSGRLYSQVSTESAQTHWQLGLRAGGNLIPDFENQIQNNFKIGLNGAVVASYKINKLLSIKTEIGFAQKGKSYQYQETQSLLNEFNSLTEMLIDSTIINLLKGYINDNVTSSYTGFHKVGYIDMPVLAELNFYKFRFSLGPYLGIMVNAYTKESLNQNIPVLDVISPSLDSLGFTGILINGVISSTFPGYKNTYTYESTDKSKFTLWNYGMIANLSFEIYKNTFLEARYTRAFNSYLKDKSNNNQLSTVSLSLSYSFGIKTIKKKIIP